ncbi:MAG: hypothetical protein MPW14_00560 [Candidatus Manganitrophus sp.]|nr:MAG: hypothetical protein MPW14_00560 [Candidatus Manganitrophus sp.]
MALKKPPPLVPSCLMAICEAAGPIASVCSVTVTFSVLRLALFVHHRLAAVVDHRLAS